MSDARQRLKCVVQKNERHIKQLRIRTLYTAFLPQFMHINFVNCITSLIFRASSTFSYMRFFVAPPNAVQLNRVKLTADYLT